MTRPRRLTPFGKWSDNPRHPWAVGWALPFPYSAPFAHNDRDDTPVVVLEHYADRITVAVNGDPEIHAEHGRTFRTDELERADLYAYETSLRFSLPFASYFALEVREDA